MGEATRDAARAAAPVLHDAVLDALGLEITSGRHVAGQALTLEQLQQRFGVSRTVMREAMRILESLHLVASRRRVGLVVQPMHRWRVLDPRVIRWRLDGPGRAAQLRTLTDLRVAVEPLAAAGAARHATAEERQRLRALAARMRQLGEAGELDAFLAADVEFHALLLQACLNEMFTALTGVIAEVLAGRTEHGLMPKCPRPVALDLHEQVANTVAAEDARGAETAMRELVEEVRDAIGTADATAPTCTE
ncbi:FadR/GntR family transcriptional regulator [Micromonospora sp. NPDC049903]|uniref:FadR/GntR family transcriptional regulator n=1 Tax=Micromonospora sp. NPDC049903 TaxID=3364276 RepID=UPI0037B7B3E5